MSLRSDEGGFTLVELLVAMALAIVVFGVTLGALGRFQNESAYNTEQNTAQDLARTALDRIAKELRNVQPQSQSIERAIGKDLVFQLADPGSAPAGPNPANVERVRYCLKSTGATTAELWRQTQTWTSATPPALLSSGACPDLSGVWNGQSRFVAGSVISDGRAVFTYNNATQPTKSTGIGVRLFIDVTPGSGAPATELTSGVDLRNQRDPPTASFSSTPSSTGNHYSALDGSGSVSPSGEPLTYTWSVDGATCGTGPTLDCDGRTTGSHQVQLVVSDPGGLTGTSTQTVAFP